MSDVADHENVGPAADPKAVRKREKDAKRRDQIAADDLRAVMGTPQGRRFVWALLTDARVYSTSFRHGEPVESAVFREGERNAGLKLLDRLHRTCADLYSLMVREQNPETDQ